MMYGWPPASSEHGVNRAQETRIVLPAAARLPAPVALEPTVKVQAREPSEVDPPEPEARPASGSSLSAAVEDDAMRAEHDDPKKAHSDAHPAVQDEEGRRKGDGRAARRANKEPRAAQGAEKENIKIAPWESK